MENSQWRRVSEAQELERDISQNFRGWARVNLLHLEFPFAIRESDTKLAATLKRKFTKSTLLRGQSDHPIKVVIADAELANALNKKGSNLIRLKNGEHKQEELTFPSDFKLDCLHGKHRIIAAGELLHSSERWWVIEFYSTGLSARARQNFIEGDSYSKEFPDGQIFRQIRLCSRRGDISGEERWRSRISKTKERDLNRLLKRKAVVAALDGLLHFTGLWEPLWFLGRLDRFEMGCDEEMITYIEDLKSVWVKAITNEAAAEKTDASSIAAVQLRCPIFSALDATFIQNGMNTGELFPKIQDAAVRESILNALLACGRIPSVYTFLQDLDYLMPQVKIMKRLLPKLKRGDTVRKGFRSHFPEPIDPSAKVFQSSEISFISFDAAAESTFELNYRQLFLYPFRYFDPMGQRPPKKDKGAQKPLTQEPKAHLWYKIAQLANQLGFRSNQITHLISEGTDARIIPQCLGALRPKEMYRPNNLQPLALQVNNALQQAYSPIEIDTRPSFTVAEAGIPISERCGLPHQESQNRDRHHLFLTKVYGEREKFQFAGDGISSFCIKQITYHSFFGDYLPIFQLSSAKTDPPPLIALIEVGGITAGTSLRPDLPPQQPFAPITTEPNRSEHLQPVEDNEMADYNLGEYNKDLLNENLISFTNDIEFIEINYDKESVHKQALAFPGASFHHQDGDYILADQIYAVASKYRIVSVVTDGKITSPPAITNEVRKKIWAKRKEEWRKKSAPKTTKADKAGVKKQKASTVKPKGEKLVKKHGAVKLREQEEAALHEEEAASLRQEQLARLHQEAARIEEEEEGEVL